MVLNFSAAWMFLLCAIAGPAQGAGRHLSGEVLLGHEFRREIGGSGLVFVLEPSESGWMIRIVPKAPCMNARDDWAAVVNSPFRNYNALYVDASYGITAKEAVGAMNPRNFSFVVTCGDFKVEGHRLEVALWPYSYSKGEAEAALAKLGTSQLGKAQFTILHSKVSEAAEDVEGKNYGKIDWMRFDVDFALPLPRVGHGQLGGLK